MVKINAPLEAIVEAQSQLIIYLVSVLHANDVFPLSDFANAIRAQNDKLAISHGAKKVLVAFADEMEASAALSAPSFTVIQGGKNGDPEPDDNGTG